MNTVNGCSILQWTFDCIAVAVNFLLMKGEPLIFLIFIFYDL